MVRYNKPIFFILFLFAVVSTLAQQPALMLPVGHTGFISCAQFSPDDKRIVTGSWDNTVKIWDVETGVLLIDLKGNDGTILSVQYSPDGKKILSVHNNGIARLWDAYTGTLLMSLVGKDSVVYSGEFSPDGKSVVTTCEGDSSVRIWDAATGLVKLNIKCRQGILYAVHYSHDGKKLVTTCQDTTIKIWNAFDGKLLLNLKGHKGSALTANFSPNDEKVATTSSDTTVKIWDAGTGRKILDVKLNIDTTYNRGFNFGYFGSYAFFSPDNKKIAVTTSARTNAFMIDLERNFSIKVLPDSGIFFAEFSPDGKTLMVTTDSLGFKLWNLDTWENKVSLKGEISGFARPLFASNGKLVATFGSTKTWIWDVSTGNQVSFLGGHEAKAQRAAFSPDAIQMAITDEHGLKIWDVSTNKVLANLKTKDDAINDATFFPGGKKIILIVDDSIKILAADTYNVLQAAKAYTLGVSPEFSADGSKFLTSSLLSDSCPQVWDAATCKLITTIKGHKGSILSAHFSPDATRVVTAGYEDKVAKVWEVATGKLVSTMKGHHEYVNSARFSPDGTKVVTAGSYDSTAKVWNTETGSLIATLSGHKAYVKDAAFTADGQTIITISHDHTAMLWNAQTGALKSILDYHDGSVLDYQFTADGRRVLLSGEYGPQLWDLQTAKKLADFTIHEKVSGIGQFSRDESKIVCVSGNNTISIWDAKTYKSLYSFITIDSTDYLCFDSLYRYDGTPAARKLLYFTCGEEVIGLDQLKEQLWVPGLAERIMKGDSINAKKLSDIDICGLTPEVRSIDSTNGKYYYTVTPRRGGLGETVLYVNGIEVSRYKPAQLTKTGKNYVLTVKKDTLQRYFIGGQINPVTVKAFTAENNISSRGVTLLHRNEVNATAPNLYAVMIGVSDYKGEGMDLRYAAKDAGDLSKTLAASARKMLNTDGKEHVFVYNLTTDSAHYLLPEKNSIKKVLADVGTKATANDILFIFFAGHGVMQGENKQFYFLTADASQATAAGAAASVGVSMQELSEWMQPGNIKAQKRILVFDACNSGQAIKDFVKMGNTGQDYVVARNNDNAEQIKAIEKLNERSGLFIISASASNQSAYEMGRYAQGLLTYSLLKAIKEQPDILDNNKYLDVSRWFNAAEKTVSSLAAETGGMQEPQLVNAGNFNVGVVDTDIIAAIQLVQEKALFGASNFQNNDESVADDDLGLSRLVDNALLNTAARSGDKNIAYVTNTNSPDAYLLSGRYEIKGNEIIMRVNLRQHKQVLYHFEVRGTKDKLDDVINNTVFQASEWIKKNRQL